MPYKDPEKVKEVHKRWWAAHKEEMSLKRKIIRLEKKGVLNSRERELYNEKRQKRIKSLTFLREFLKKKEESKKKTI